jgi:hypothetical protein
MLMTLSIDIHLTITSIRGNDFAVGERPAHTPWSEESRKRILDNLEHHTKLIDDLTGDITEKYFPFSCG